MSTAATYLARRARQGPPDGGNKALGRRVLFDGTRAVGVGICQGWQTGAGAVGEIILAGLACSTRRSC